MAGGMFLGVIGLAWFTQIDVGSSFVTHVLPAELLVSLGLGLAFVPMSSTALIGVEPEDAGVASAMVNTTQQVGGSLGIALLNTIAASSAAGYMTSHAGAAVASGLVHGYTTAFSVSTGLLVVAVMTTIAIVRASRHDVPAAGAAELGVAA